MRVATFPLLSLPCHVSTVPASIQDQDMLHSSPPQKQKVAIIGSGNIGTDLMIKIMRTSEILEMGALVGIDPESDGLKRATRLGIPVTDKGVDGLVALPGWQDIG